MRSVLMQGFNLTAMHEIVNFDKEYTRFLFLMNLAWSSQIISFT